MDNAGARAADFSLAGRTNEVGRGQLDAFIGSGGHDCGMMLGWDHAGLPPRVNRAAGEPETASEAPPSEAVDHVHMAKLVLHGQSCTKTSHSMSTERSHRPLSGNLVHFLAMPRREVPDSELCDVSAHLRRLRRRASPKLTVRDMATKLGMSDSSYAHYESKAFKGQELPAKHRGGIVRILLEHGIPASEMEIFGRAPEDDQALAKITLLLEQLLKRVDRIESVLVRAPTAPRQTAGTRSSSTR